MGDGAKTEAEIAVEELRLFISAYEGVDLHPESRVAKHLDAARRAVAGYEALERELANRAA